jgi:glycosyltransferase involved in cell wall biosynthesis
VFVGGTEADIAHWQAEAHTPNVHFAGFVPNHELPTYLAASDVLLMPYQRQVAVYGGVGDSSAYMCPMKMFEYMATERLIISSDLPVLHDTLNASNAVLCDPEDVDAWETALRRAMDDPAWAAGVARKARRDVEAHTWQLRARRILAGLDL